MAEETLAAPPVPPRKFVLLTPKFMTRGDSEQMMAEISKHLETYGRPFTIMLSVKHWEDNFARCGSWQAWQAELTGASKVTGKNTFDVFVAPIGCTGRATAGIVEMIQARNAVFVCWDADHHTLQRAGIECTNASDMKSGWTIYPLPVVSST